MNVISLKENLQRPIALLSRYVSARPALPVLANLLIETGENHLVLSATNLDVTVKAIIPATILEHGKTTVPARVFAEMMSQLPAGDVKLQAQENQLKLEANGTKASFATIPAIDFPVLPVYQQDRAFSFPLELLKDMTEKVLFAAATDESRPVLTSLLIQQADEQLLFVATDGFRLSEVVKPAQPQVALAQNRLLLPAKIVGELMKISTEGQAKELWIDLASQANQVALKVGEIEFFSKLIDAPYPEYTRIIPKDFVTTVEVEREAFLHAVKIAMVFAKDAGSLIKCEIDPEAGEMRVVAQSAAVGENNTVVPLRGQGETLVTAFNSRFLTDALSAFKEEQLQLSLKNPLAPMLLMHPTEKSFRHIIMPINIDA